MKPSLRICAVCHKHFKTDRGFWQHIYYGDENCRRIGRGLKKAKEVKNEAEKNTLS